MLCALESTSNHEANKQILAIFPHDSQLSHYPIFVESLENVRFVKVSYGDLIRNCGRGMSELWDSGKLQASEFYHRSVFPVCTKIKTTRSFLFFSHLSDVLRQCLLFRVGGRYLDSDVVTLTNFPENPRNFIVVARRSKLSSSVLQFERGHGFLESSIELMVNIHISILTQGFNFA